MIIMSHLLNLFIILKRLKCAKESSEQAGIGNGVKKNNNNFHYTKKSFKINVRYKIDNAILKLLLFP